MKVNVVAALLAIALFVPAVEASSSTIIDFNELTYTDPFYQFVNPVNSGGFTFSNDCPSAATLECMGVWNKDSAFQADTGHAAVFVNFAYSTTLMTRNNGEAFNLISIDLADARNDGLSVNIDLTFYHSDGSINVQSVTLDHSKGLETFTFDQTDLASVSWKTISGANGWNQFDNVVVDDVAIISIPEPQTIIMLLAGLGLLGFLLRCRKESIV